MPKRIMIVDDSATIRMVAGIALRGAGYEVLEAKDGQDALNQLGSQKINLIISDVNMPSMDGITFVKAIKAMAQHRFTPIIMLTTESGEAMKREGQAAGAKAWMVKPFKPEQMLNAVQKLCLP